MIPARALGVDRFARRDRHRSVAPDAAMGVWSAFEPGGVDTGQTLEAVGPLRSMFEFLVCQR
jgi:hypothetical protein